MARTTIGNDRNDTALQRYNDVVFMRDDKYFYWGNDGDGAIHSAAGVATFSGTWASSDNAGFTGTWQMSDATVILPFPRLEVKSQQFDRSDAGVVLNAGASDISFLLSDINLPSDSIVLGCRVVTTSDWAGSDNTSAIMVLGFSAGASDVSGGGMNVFNANTSDQGGTTFGAAASSGTTSFRPIGGDIYGLITVVADEASDIEKGDSTAYIYFIRTTYAGS